MGKQQEPQRLPGGQHRRRGHRPPGLKLGPDGKPLDTVKKGNPKKEDPKKGGSKK